MAEKKFVCCEVWTPEIGLVGIQDCPFYEEEAYETPGKSPECQDCPLAVCEEEPKPVAKLYLVDGQVQLSFEPIPGAPVEMSRERTGYRLKKGVDCHFLVYDLVIVFSDGSVAREDRAIQEMEVPAHRKGHDICFYCGADNGPNGEFRQPQDWDPCWHCGGI